MTDDDADDLARPYVRGEDDDELADLLEEVAKAPSLGAYDLLGAKVGRFTVTSALGRGGMGVVYRAFDETLGRDVALKVLRRDLGQQRDTLLAEARSAARLSHPHLAAVYDVFEHHGALVLALELVEGPSLAALLSERKLSDEEVVRIATGIARALAAAHEAGLTHRDVKPQNILLRADGEPRLVDFGLAARPGDDVLRGGTPGYMPPEQAGGQNSSAPTVDVYAFGVVLGEMLIGERPPRTERGPTRLLAPTRPRALCALADRCQAEQPERRPPDGQAIVDDPALSAPVAPASRYVMAAGVVAALLAALFAVPTIERRLTALPPSLASLPLITDDSTTQRMFSLAVQSFYAGDREGAERILISLTQKPTSRPHAHLLRLLVGQGTTDRRDLGDVRAGLERMRDSGALGDHDRALIDLAQMAERLRPGAPGQRIPAELAAPLLARARPLLRGDPEHWFEELMVTLLLPRTNGDARERLAHLNVLSALDDEPPLLAITKSWTLQHHGDPEAAQTVLEEALLRHPGHVFLEQELATLEIALGAPAAARDRLEVVVRERPRDVVARFSLAEADLLAGGDAWPGMLADLLEDPYPRHLAARGTLLFTEAAAARGQVAAARPLRDDALDRLRANGFFDDATAALERLLAEARELSHEEEHAHWRSRADALARGDEVPGYLRARLAAAIAQDDLYRAVERRDPAAARQVLSRLVGMEANAFPPDVGQARTLAEARAFVLALEGQIARSLVALDDARRDLRDDDLDRRARALVKGELHLLAGETVQAQEAFSAVLEREPRCLASTLFWEVRCRRDLLLALAHLRLLEPSRGDEHTARMTRILARPDPELPLLDVTRR